MEKTEKIDAILAQADKGFNSPIDFSSVEAVAELTESDTLKKVGEMLDKHLPWGLPGHWSLHWRERVQALLRGEMPEDLC